MIVNVEHGLSAEMIEKMEQAIERDESVEFTGDSEHVRALVVPLFTWRMERLLEARQSRLEGLSR